MANETKKFDSVGGFSVNKTTVVDELRNAKDINTLQIKNSFFSDATKTNYILRGSNSGNLLTNNVGGLLILPSSTISFITAHAVAVNQNNGGGNYSVKIESAVDCNSIGNVTVLSSMTTIIKDNVPTGETWGITTYDAGTANRFSYTVSRAGTFDTIKWVAAVEVVSISWTS